MGPGVLVYVAADVGPGVLVYVAADVGPGVVVYVTTYSSRCGSRGYSVCNYI